MLARIDEEFLAHRTEVDAAKQEEPEDFDENGEPECCPWRSLSDALARTRFATSTASSGIPAAGVRSSTWPPRVLWTFPEPRVVSWLAALEGRAEFRSGEVVRIDSPGEDPEVARRLRGSAEPIDMYRVEARPIGMRASARSSTHWTAGSARRCCVARRSRRVAGHVDKMHCHALLSDAGVAVRPR